MKKAKREKKENKKRAKVRSGGGSGRAAETFRSLPQALDRVDGASWGDPNTPERAGARGRIEPAEPEAPPAPLRGKGLVG